SVIRHDAASVNTIGILDIFGFENLVSNGFEQLCINYANERLQSQFNDLVFAKEQRMYEAEGIEWKYIEYPDNAPCLQLLEDRPMGMWCLLDEEGMLPKGTNEGWITKLYSQYLDDSTTVDDAKVPTSRRQSCPEQGKGKMPSLSQPTPRKPSRPFFSTSSQRVEFQFVVGHFAGRVVYENDTYLEKNQDALPGEALELCRSSSNEIVQSLLQLTGTATASGKRGGASKSRKPPVVLRQPSSIRSTSVSAQFKSQLDDLIQVIGSTQARYIRCVKPNDVHTPRELNKARVVQQLRSGGVLEAVRIARAGYAVRVDHGSFVDAFGFFKPRTSAKKDLQGVCEQIVAAIMLQFYANDAPGIVDIATTVARGQTARIDRQAFHEACGSVGFQLGNSKIFFRKDVYNDLRRFRRQIMARHATLLQRNVRGFLGRKVAAARRRAAAVLQTWMRQCLAYRARVRASVLKLQTWVRSRVAMSKYHRFVRAMETLQKFGRHVLWTTRFQAKVQMRVVMRPPLEIPKPRQTTTPRAKTTPTKKSAAAPRVSATKANGRSRHGHDDDDDDGQEQRGTGDAVLAALTLQNELLKQELDILRKQTAAQVQIHLNRVDTMPPGPSSHAPTEEYAVFDPAEHSYGYGHPSMAPPPAFYHPDQFSPPPPAPPAPAFTELEFAHQQIISLSQQLLVTQIKYSNLLMDYNEHLCGYDADKPALSDDAFAMVEALDIPCPATLDCAQEQLRALLRKLHMAQEKLKHLEADMYGQFTNDSGFAVATGAASMLLHPNATKMTRGESIDTVEFTPRRSSEWRPHFDDHIGGSSRQLHSMALPAIHDYDNDECMSEVDNLEYEQKVEELQRQVDLLRMSVMHKPRATNSHGATMAMTASTVSSSRSSIGSMTEGQLADLRRSFGYRPNTPRRLTYHVKDVTTWARDDKCFECKVEFGFFTRRHHCRMCSQSFCHGKFARPLYINTEGLWKKCQLDPMMQNMFLNEGGIINIQNVTLPKASFAKIRPQSTDFHDITNPRAVLEATLRKFSCMTVGDTISITYNNRNYLFDVRELRPADAVCIIETDCELDFDAPVDYVPPVAPAAPAVAAPIPDLPYGGVPTVKSQDIKVTKPVGTGLGGLGGLRLKPGSNTDAEALRAARLRKYEAFHGTGVSVTGVTSSTPSMAAAAPPIPPQESKPEVKPPVAPFQGPGRRLR
ncbi:hypothetical protein DYB32_008284, partial [Aphanomyces invadans]